jgi:hypothetical protein
MTSPDQEKSTTKQINATTLLPSSHVPMPSHPKEVAAVIEQAASGKSASAKAAF